MNPLLATIINAVEQNESLSAEVKQEVKQAAAEVERVEKMTAFRLERSETDRRMLTVILEETIEDLEKKRKSIEETNAALENSLQALRVAQAELELKNRDLEIENALERVRAQAMSLTRPEDLARVGEIIFSELKMLGFADLRNTEIIINKDNNTSVLSYYYSDYGVTGIIEVFYDSHPTLKSWIEEMKKASDAFAGIVIAENEMDAWRKYRLEIGYKPDPKLDAVNRVYYYSYSIGLGALSISSFTRVSEEQMNILARFRNVFSLAYRRYADVTQAVSQAREAQIEVALERVRARTMAMQKSSELAETVSLLFKQLLGLGIKSTQIRTCAIVTFHSNEPLGECYITKPDGEIIPHPFIVPYNEISSYQSIYDAWKNGEKFHLVHLSGDALAQHFKFLKKYTKIPVADFQMPAEIPSETYTHAMFFSQGYLFIVSSEALPEYHEIFKRFGSVFQQTYTRFLDLQKAEAQARESRIEAALERVRSRAMGMQSSDELIDVANVMRLQMGILGQPDLETSAIHLYTDESKTFNSWYAYRPPNDPEEKIRTGTAKFPTDSGELVSEMISMYRSPATDYTLLAKGPKMQEWLEVLFKAAPEYRQNTQLATLLPETTYFHFSDFTGGSLLMVTYQEPTQEVKSIQRRAASVFDLAYRRFLDLKNAEAQTRESQIEVALERVRSRTLAMHRSDELAETAAVVFRQLILLGIAPNRLYIGIIKDESGNMELWATDEDGSKVSTRFTGNIHRNASVKKMYDGWKAMKKGITIDMEGRELADYFHYLKEELHVPFQLGLTQKRRVQHLAYFSKGFIGIASPGEQPQETLELLERFAAVFNLTYTRFNDLQNAEAQTHKANIEVALERVRARALAMQQPEELIEVAEVMRQEMGLLGVEELETSSIYIHHKGSDSAECWYAIRDEKHPLRKLVSDHMHMDLQQTWVGREMLKFEASEDKTTSILMSGENRREWLMYCYALSKPLDKFYGDDFPERTYHLCKFSNGYMGAAAPGNISEESRELLARASSVFSLAYSRFKDLSQARVDLLQLKTEKRRAEEALTELKSAQAQLIQSEKMASLGELTAGIAHEIQNPLNFVNNFSEVNAELIEELEQEANKGNLEEVKIIAKDISANEQKINLHGKRADAIVKGMLQHSRVSSGDKIPTDINSLADEYLRLAYHGLRSKDNSFNATLITEYDGSLEKINVIPQDIGRVLLNLYNNAFYAVAEKAKASGGEYKPTIKVETRQIPPLAGQRGAGVSISVRDNGPGIPQKVLDKIFQPFFTTKPTGQGTGLGLSLSYDMIKAHGGEIRVETKEARPDEPVGRGEGSEFIIQLPIV